MFGSFVVFAIVSVLIASQIGGNGDVQMMTFLVLIVLSLGVSFFLGYVKIESPERLKEEYSEQLERAKLAV